MVGDLTKPISVSTNLQKNNFGILHRFPSRRWGYCRIIYIIHRIIEYPTLNGVVSFAKNLPTSVKVTMSGIVFLLLLIEIYILIHFLCLINDKCFYTHFGG